MACGNYKIIQLTNNSIGSITANAYMPLGSVTRKISGNNNTPVPFEVTTSGADTVDLTNKGYYKVTYNASLVATAAGIVKLNLVAGGSTVYSVSATATLDGTVNMSLAYDVRVFANCDSMPTNCPLPVQIQLDSSSVDITSGTSNLIIDSCVNG